MVVLLLAGCGAPSEPLARKDAAAAVAKNEAPAPVVDHSSVLPRAGQTGTRLVPDHILGVPKLPGGALGEYNVNGRKYQLFIVEADTNQKAAFMLLDLKATIKDAEYFPNTGGYFGSDGNRNIYVFAKKHYLAGVVGLKRADADRTAIELASHLL